VEREARQKAKTNQQIRDSLLAFVRRSFPDYLAGWVHEEVCEALEAFSRACAAGESPRLMINLPFRHGKSFLSSERFPAWHLGRHPDHEIILASYAQDLSNTFSRRVKDLVQEDWYKEAFPTFSLKGDSKAVNHWQTDQGGGLKAVGIKGGSTGHGAHVLILDDIYKDVEQADSPTYRDKVDELYKTSLYSRLAPGGGVLILNTRWHDDDLNGRIIDKEGHRWRVVAYPATAVEDEPHRKKGDPLHPERYDAEAIADLHVQLGPKRASALLQQDPIPDGGGIFQKAWAVYWHPSDGVAKHKLDPQHLMGGRKVLSIDCNFKKTTSGSHVAVLLLWSKGPNLYLLDGWWERVGFVDTLAKCRQMTGRWHPVRRTFIEDKANGSAVIDVLEEELPGLIAVNPRGGKEARAHAVSGYVKAGNLILPHPSLGYRWAADFERLLFRFPASKPDDPIDALTQAMSHELGGKGASWLHRLLNHT
jgi:predicted phage terminase large subunit-like protein